MLFPFKLFVMNEDDLSIYLYSDLKRPLGRNTDDRLITEFSTPKQIIRNQKVARFLDPERIHGNIEEVMAMMDHIDNEEVLRILDRKIRENGSIYLN